MDVLEISGKAIFGPRGVSECWHLGCLVEACSTPGPFLK